MNAAAAGSTTIISIIVTSLLLGSWGAEKYGLWMLVLTMSFDRGYMALLDFGHGAAALQQLVGDDMDHRRAIKRTLVRKYLGFSTVGLVFLILVGPWFLNFVTDESRMESPWKLVMIIAIRLPIDMLHMSNMVELESRSRYGIMRSIDFVSNASWLIFAILAASNSASVTSAVSVYLLIGVVQLVLSTLSTRGDIGFDWRVSPGADSESVDLWSRGKWIALQRISGIIYANMDRLIISFAVGLVGVGEYEIPYKIQALGVLLLSILPSAVFPVAAKLQSNDAKRQLGDLFTRGTRLAAAVCVPPLMALIILSEPLTVIWVGDEYRHLSDSVKLFTSWTFLAVFHVVGATMLNAIGKNKEVFLLGAASIIINLPLSITFGLQWGINGVVTGTLAGYAVVFFPYLYVELKTFDVMLSYWIKRVVFPVAIPGAIQAVLSICAVNLLGANPGVVEVGVTGLGSTLIGWALFFGFFAPAEDRRAILSAIGSRT